MQIQIDKKSAAKYIIIYVYIYKHYTYKLLLLKLYIIFYSKNSHVFKLINSYI